MAQARRGTLVHAAAKGLESGGALDPAEAEADLRAKLAVIALHPPEGAAAPPLAAPPLAAPSGQPTSAGERAAKIAAQRQRLTMAGQNALPAGAPPAPPASRPQAPVAHAPPASRPQAPVAHAPPEMKIVSAKLNSKQLKGMQSKAVSQLQTYKDVLLPPTAADLTTRFGGSASTYAAAADIDVKWNGGSTRLSNFRAQYLSSTPATSVVVEGVTVGPDEGRSNVFHLAIDRTKLMQIMSTFVDAVLGGASTRPKVT